MNGSAANWTGKAFSIVDSAGLTLTCMADDTLSVGVNVYSATDPTTTMMQFGCDGLASTAAVADVITDAVNAANSGAYIDITAALSTSTVVLVQDVAGPAGNTTISLSGLTTSEVIVTSFTGGAAGVSSALTNFGTAIVTGTSGNKTFIWGEDFAVFPATQISSYGTRLSRYRRKNNEFLFPAAAKKLTPITARFTELTTTSSYSDRAGNSIHTSFSNRFVEPVITSKYKPLTTKIKTFRGTPSRAEFDQTMTVDVKYAYGNDLQGFANKKMNVLLGNREQYQSGLIKRPYEVFRDSYISNFDRVATGMDLVESIVYPETIFPKEIYTYSSGSRSRQSFENRRIWSSDQPSGTIELYGTEQVAAMGSSSLLYSFINDKYIFTDAPAQSRFSPRYTGKGPYVAGDRWAYMVNWEDPDGFRTSPGAYQDPKKPAALWTGSIIPTAFMTSQDYRLLRQEQTPWNKGLGWTDSGLDVEGGKLTWGTGSVWPLDSYPFWTSSLDTSVYEHGRGQVLKSWVVYDSSPRAKTVQVEIAAASSLPCGELLMPHYGNVVVNLGTTSQGSTTWSTSSLLSAQYVYSVPTETYIDRAMSSSANYKQVEPRSPGGPYTRPEWSAGKRRRIIDGPQKYQLTAQQFPFYDSYEKFVEDAKLVGKDQSIIPEFRISNHIESYDAGGSVMTSITGTLELTGAYSTGTAGLQPQPNPNSGNPDFLTRYSTSDLSAYLSTFMRHRSTDLQFNKKPRQLKLESKATVKLLPYEGFYPVNRTLQLAGLFSQSYGPYAEYGSLTYDGSIAYSVPEPT